MAELTNEQKCVGVLLSQGHAQSTINLLSPQEIAELAALHPITPQNVEQFRAFWANLEDAKKASLEATQAVAPPAAAPAQSEPAPSEPASSDPVQQSAFETREDV